MTRGLLLLPGLLLAGVLALGATTGWAGPPEDELPPCEWFIDLAEGYPELEILSCEGEWGAPVWAGEGGPYWEGYGLLSWDGKRAAFRGIAGHWWVGPTDSSYGDPEQKYVFEWSMHQYIHDRYWSPCRSVRAWVVEVDWRDVPEYNSVPVCTIVGAAFNSGEQYADLWWWPPKPGVAWFVHGVLHEHEGDTARFRAILSHDLRVEIIHVDTMDGELLVGWYDAPAPAPADAGTGLAPPGLFTPEIALRVR